jgi:hypothetical protein
MVFALLVSIGMLLVTLLSYGMATALIVHLVVAYEEALSRCSTERAPWHIIPSDCKWFRNLAVARIVVDCLEGLEIRPPLPTVDLGAVRKEYKEAAK